MAEYDKRKTRKAMLLSPLGHRKVVSCSSGGYQQHYYASTDLVVELLALVGDITLVVVVVAMVMVQ